MKRRGLIALLLAAPAAFALDRCWLKTPGYSWCGRCKCTWDKTGPDRGHSTVYRRHACKSEQGLCVSGEGVFPLCEKCWCELRTPSARMPFYLSWWEQWGREGKIAWSEIEAAVLSEGEGCAAPPDAGTPITRIDPSAPTPV